MRFRLVDIVKRRHATMWTGREVTSVFIPTVLVNKMSFDGLSIIMYQSRTGQGSDII
jgi:hypothetical protein